MKKIPGVMNPIRKREKPPQTGTTGPVIQKEREYVRTNYTDEAGRTLVPFTGNQKEVFGLCGRVDYRG